jgi:predicted anti-sigma-YlaC factor YlaD
MEGMPSQVSMDVSSQLCARARFWASLRIDGELSELEGALLDAHLARCAECCDVVGGFEGSTASLRTAALAKPAPVAIPHGGTSRRVLAAMFVAAVVAVAAIAGGLVHHESATSTTRPHTAVAVVASVDTPDQLRRLRRTTLLNQRRLPHEYSAETV